MYPHGKDILVIDSDAARRGLIEHILAGEGFAITTVAEGLAGLRALMRQRFSLLIAAADLPGTLDGATLARQARARQPGLKTLLTGDHTIYPRLPGADRDDFIPAPFHRRELIGCVFELLQREGLPGAADLARRCRAEAYAG
jgi:DNA-binding response OmpR family regulator